MRELQFQYSFFGEIIVRMTFVLKMFRQYFYSGYRMVSFISGDIKDIFTIKLKTRQDDYTDQFSRIFMMKMFLIASLVMGVDWFQDTVNCMLPDIDFYKIGEDYVHSACWIQGYSILPPYIPSSLPLLFISLYFYFSFCAKFCPHQNSST